jgi:hypothetical protein
LIDFDEITSCALYIEGFLLLVENLDLDSSTQLKADSSIFGDVSKSKGGTLTHLSFSNLL